MDTNLRLLGSQCQLIAASGVNAVTSGYRAYALKVRVDNTQISSVTKIENDNSASGVITNESWMNQNLLAGIDYISFEDPITSITLVSGTPNVMLFLEKNV